MNGPRYVLPSPPGPRRPRRVDMSSAVYAALLAFALGVVIGIQYTRGVYEPLLEERAAEARYHQLGSGAPIAPVWITENGGER